MKDLFEGKDHTYRFICSWPENGNDKDSGNWWTKTSSNAVNVHDQLATLVAFDDWNPNYTGNCHHNSEQSSHYHLLTIGSSLSNRWVNVHGEKAGGTVVD